MLASRLSFAAVVKAPGSGPGPVESHHHHQEQEQEQGEFQLDDGTSWIICITEKEDDGDGGYAYYYETATGHTQWEDPRDIGKVEHPATGDGAEAEEDGDHVLNASVSDGPYSINV